MDKYQLLAAASHREPTPLPRDRSFTNTFLRRLQEHFPESHPSPEITIDFAPPESKIESAPLEITIDDAPRPPAPSKCERSMQPS